MRDFPPGNILRDPLLSECDTPDANPQAQYPSGSGAAPLPPAELEGAPALHIFDCSTGGLLALGKDSPPAGVIAAQLPTIADYKPPLASLAQQCPLVSDYTGGSFPPNGHAVLPEVRAFPPATRTQG